jgi:formylglycine-generating enzyme required for sulfatase activity
VQIDREQPQHKVRITRPFYLGAHEVTEAQFRQFYEDSGYKLDSERRSSGLSADARISRPWAPGWRASDQKPVVYVSWNDAEAFCDWLSRREGRHYRLPTEAEWEYAARAGSSHRFCFGDDEGQLTEYGNVSDVTLRTDPMDVDLVVDELDDDELHAIDERGAWADWPYLVVPDGYVAAAPVGQFKPNAWGLYDMHGNVSEWCFDWHHPKYYETSPMEDPQGPSAGIARVIRGGSWRGLSESQRCANREFNIAIQSNDTTGFRVVCEFDGN